MKLSRFEIYINFLNIFFVRYRRCQFVRVFCVYSQQMRLVILYVTVRTRNSADNNGTTTKTTTIIRDLLRTIFGRFSHSWFFRSSEVLGAKWSNVTSPAGGQRGFAIGGFCRERIVGKKSKNHRPLSRITLVTLHTRDYSDVSRYSLAISRNHAIRRFAQSLREQKCSYPSVRLAVESVQFGMRLTGQGRGVDIERGKRSLTVAFVSYQRAALGERTAQGWSIDHSSIRSNE